MIGTSSGLVRRINGETTKFDLKNKRYKMGKNISVLSIVGKAVSYILFFAVAWIIIRWFWLSYDWLPMVKSEIPGICIPLLFLKNYLLL